MTGYKAFNKDLTCRGMQYEVGQTYEMKENPICCKRGFHFCKNIADVYKFYDMSDDTRICEVQALGEVVTDDNIKYCTNKIRIVKEIKNKAIKHCNLDKSTIGFLNSGYYNSGNNNIGYKNSGSANSGDHNSGNCNSGDCNSGEFNCGDFNSGNFNSGDYNSGYYNSGDHNNGYCNSGNYNSGDHNIGCRNSGDFNSGNFNSGYCNTTNSKVRMFNHETDMDFDDVRLHRFRQIMFGMPHSYIYSNYISEVNMSDEEKERHPEYKTIGGYIKVIKIEADKWKWWNENVSDEDKEFIKSLPYYDEDVFFASTGIK